MLDMRIEVDLPDMQAWSHQRPNDLKETKQALKASLMMVQQTWMAAVYGATLPGMLRPLRNREYLDALSSPDAVVVPDGRELSGSVVSSYEYTEDVERGYESFDQKPGMINGPKSRALADGSGRYNIIPLRHATPNAQASAVRFSTVMPTEIYNYIKRKDYGESMSRGALERIDRRISRKQPTRLTMMGKELQNTYTMQKHHSPLYERLTKKGSPHHSQFLTFRTVSTHSNPNSWIHPGLPANPVMEAVTIWTRPAVEQLIQEAARRDIMAALGM